jgi:DNA-binding MurR/RpiR family transcriptional regulator
MSEGKTRARRGSATTPKTFDDLERQLRDGLAQLSPAHQRLATRVVADPEGVAFMTISELAEAVGVNESTVVRFATSLGLEGYPALSRLCQERLREQAQMLRRFDHVRATSDGGRGMLVGTADYDGSNISRTFARLDPVAWEQAADAISGASAVHVLGLRKCHAVAYLLGYLLGLIREEVHTLGSAGLTEELRRLKETDVFVAVAIHRYTKDTVRALRYASSIGCTTIAMTDNPSSPLAAHADHVFYVDTSSVSVLRSVTAFISLAQALAGEVAQRREASTRSALKEEERLLSLFEVYEEGPDALLADQGVQAAERDPPGR